MDSIRFFFVCFSFVAFLFPGNLDNHSSIFQTTPNQKIGITTSFSTGMLSIPDRVMEALSSRIEMVSCGSARMAVV